MEEEDSYQSVGFMFDAEARKEQIEICLQGIKILLKLIDEEPGHVQSGQYLWPASYCLSNHLITCWDNLKAENVLELGAGVGMGGILCSRLAGVKTVTLTDYDPGSLELLNDNIELNAVDNSQTSCKCKSSFLQWGSDISPDSDIFMNHYDLIIGSDLLYCTGVVNPLLKTVARIFATHPVGSSSSPILTSNLFVLASSFEVGKEIENAVEKAAAEYNLSVENVEPLVVSNGIKKSRIQYIRKLC